MTRIKTHHPDDSDEIGEDVVACILLVLPSCLILDLDVAIFDNRDHDRADGHGRHAGGWYCRGEDACLQKTRGQ